jgi:hypothetical protein
MMGCTRKKDVGARQPMKWTHEAVELYLFVADERVEMPVPMNAIRFVRANFPSLSWRIREVIGDIADGAS